MSDRRHSLPPAPPPKGNDRLDVQSPAFSEDPDASGISQQDALDDMSESSPVERTSHATFIAPALPPIRFSLNTADFAELLNSVQGPLDEMATLLQEPDRPSTPPKTSSTEAKLTVDSSQPTTANEEGKQPHLSQDSPEPEKRPVHNQK
jgi:hypothetical protein